MLAVFLAAPMAAAFPPAHPYIPSSDDILTMVDDTSGFSGGQQLSTQTLSANPDGLGITSSAHFRRGTGSGDGEGFARLVLANNYLSGSGINLSAYDGIQWTILSSVPLDVKPYTQTLPNFTFYEGSQNLGAGSGIISVPANVVTSIPIDWNMVTNGGSIPQSERSTVRLMGFQMFGPFPAVGQTIDATIVVSTQIAQPSPHTFTYNTTTTSNAWLNSANWTGGALDRGPGVDANPSSLIDHHALDIAEIGTINFPVANGLGINMGISANTGINNNATSGGLLRLGAINFTSTSFTDASSTGLTTLQIGNRSTTPGNAGILQLNGATVGGVPGTIIAATGTKNLTIANNDAGSAAVTMGLRLGGASSVIHATGANTVAINSNITELSAGSSLTKTGTGTLTLGGVNSFSGETKVSGGALRLNNAAALQSSTLDYNNYGGSLSFGALAAATLGGLKGAQNLTLTNQSAAAVTLTVGRNNANTTYSGQLSGAGSLIKTGTGTLTLSASQTYSGSTTINGGKLAVNGSLAGPVTVNTAGALGGNATVNGSVANSGRVAPGNSPGTITINGDYTQSATGTLEIEVGGLAPALHDNVVVTPPGVASLNGTLHVPVINGFTPSAGQQFTFLTAATINGAFTSLSSSGLPANVAIRVGDAPEGGLQARQVEFINPLQEIELKPPEAPGPLDWNVAATTWKNISNTGTPRVPTTADVITVSNNSGVEREVQVQSANAFVHQLALTDSDDPFKVTVTAGQSLSAVDSATVGENAVISLDNGNLVSGQVDVTAGGTITGNGVIKTDELIVGATLSEEPAKFQPGLNGVGTTSIEGDYTQGAGGELTIDVASNTLADKINLQGTADFGGTLVVNVTNDATVQPGSTIQIVTATGLVADDAFDLVRTEGSTDTVFVPRFTPGAVSATVSLQGLPRGDLSLDGVFNPAADAAALAQAFTNPAGYKASHQGTSGAIMGNVNNDDYFDFDDIVAFRQLAGMTVAELALIFEQAARVSEPSSGLLAGLALLMRRSRSGRRA